MEITEHQANILRALLDRKRIQYCRKAAYANEKDYVDVEDWSLVLTFLMSPTHEVRIKPDVIIVNGIEVPAPEKEELPEGANYWIANATDDDGRSLAFCWHGGDTDKKWLRYGIVHTSSDAAAAHGKAMRAHKPG